MLKRNNFFSFIAFANTLFAGTFAATEIRCQEKSKGGLCYEVILGHPAIAAPARQNKTSPTKNLTAEEIERKLREAEERRLVRTK